MTQNISIVKKQVLLNNIPLKPAPAINHKEIAMRGNFNIHHGPKQPEYSINEQSSKSTL